MINDIVFCDYIVLSMCWFEKFCGIVLVNFVVYSSSSCSVSCWEFFSFILLRCISLWMEVLKFFVMIVFDLMVDFVSFGIICVRILVLCFFCVWMSCLSWDRKILTWFISCSRIVIVIVCSEELFFWRCGELGWCVVLLFFFNLWVSILFVDVDVFNLFIDLWEVFFCFSRNSVLMTRRSFLFECEFLVKVCVVLLSKFVSVLIVSICCLFFFM